MLNAIATLAIATATPDETAILESLDRFATTWNKNDADAIAVYFTDDALRVGASGDIAHGRKEIRASYAKLFHGPFAGVAVKVSKPSVRMLADGLALRECSITLGDIEGYVVEVMVKRDGKWLILESHPKLYPPKPAAVVPVKTGMKAGGMSLNDNESSVVAVKTDVKAGGVNLNDNESSVVVVAAIRRAS